jgi:hypothetical protein
MKTFEDQNKELVNFDKTFDSSDFSSCVQRAILLIKNRESQMIEEGYEWPINTESCRWAIEQAIINRSSSKTMMDAAIDYVESIEYSAEKFNGIEGQ